MSRRWGRGSAHPRSSPGVANVTNCDPRCCNHRLQDTLGAEVAGDRHPLVGRSLAIQGKTMLQTAAAEWLPYVTAFSALAVSLITFIVGPWAEVRKLRGQRGESEREKLRDLIEKYHGRLLEAAVDWDRRMQQLYEHEPARGRRGDPYDRRGPEHPDEHYLSHLRGVDFLDQGQYLYRSYVFRFLGLCALARKIEAEAFYIDAQYARPQDFDFLKFAKALLWAMTSTDLSRDEFPGQSHFPNDQSRPVLDRCYRALDDDLPHVVDATEHSEVIFDVAFLHRLVARERELPDAQPVVARRAAHGDPNAENGNGVAEEGDLRPPETYTKCWPTSTAYIATRSMRRRTSASVCTGGTACASFTSSCWRSSTTSATTGRWPIARGCSNRSIRSSTGTSLGGSATASTSWASASASSRGDAGSIGGGRGGSMAAWNCLACRTSGTCSRHV